MSRACTVCGDPAAGIINAELTAGRVVRQVAAAHSLSYDAVLRHSKRHVAVPAVEPVDRSAPADSGQLGALAELVEILRTRALSSPDPAVAREYRLAMAAADSQNVAPAAVPLEQTAEWIELRTILMQTLAGYPEARWAIVAALRADIEANP